MVCSDDLFGIKNQKNIFEYDMHATIKQASGILGFTLDKLDVVDQESLKERTTLANISCAGIQYTDVYRKMGLTKVNHYIYVSDARLGKIFIHDPYIPSKIQESYCGYIEITDILDKIEAAYYIEVSDGKINREKQRKNILKSAEIVLENNFDTMIKREKYILEKIERLGDKERHELFWELAIRLKGSGLIASRILFKEILFELDMINPTISEIAEKVCQNYICLEYEFLKCKYKIDSYVIGDIIKRLHYICKMEINLTERLIYKICNDRGE